MFLIIKVMIRQCIEKNRVSIWCELKIDEIGNIKIDMELK